MRRAFASAVAALALVATILAAPTPASADTSYTNAFTRTKTWHSKPLGLWFRITMKGKITATYWHKGAGQSTAFYFGKPEISDPVMTVEVFSNKAMTKRAKVRKLELRQYYYDRECKYKPSLSASASTSKALSIGLSVTSVCEDFTTGYRASSYGSGPRFTQNSSGAAVMWKGKYDFWQGRVTPDDVHVCVTGEFEMQPYLTRTKDDLLKFRFSDICKYM